MSALPSVECSEAKTFREAGLLDSDRGTAALARAIPAVAQVGWRISDYVPLRFDVRSRISLTGEVRVAAAGARSASKLAFEATLAEPVPGPWAGHDPESAIAFRLSPADRRLPLLASALDPGRSGDSLFGTSSGRAELVAHRFGRRATLRVAGAGQTLVWIKLWVRDRAGRIAGLHGRIARSARGFRVAEVRHHDPRGGLAAFDPLEGISLHGSLDGVEPPLGPLLADTVLAISDVEGDDLPAWTVDDEMRNLRAFVRRAAYVDSGTGARIAARVADFERDDPAPPASRSGLVHRDLHDKQILLGPPEPGVLDWDLAAHGPAGLDAGNLLAHFTLRALQAPDRQQRLRAVAAAFAAAWCRHPGDATVLEWWTRVALLRLACVYAMRPGATQLARRTLAAVDGAQGREVDS